MERPPPKTDPPVIDPAKPRFKQDERITQVRRYKLITPLFGGGVTVGENDELTPISGKAIRGHLRFWWRATRGGKFNGDLGSMKDFEERLFGAAGTKDKERPSQIQIVVTEASELAELMKEKPYIAEQQVNEKWKELAYAAFPFQDNPQFVTFDVSFQLAISFPPKIEDRDGNIGPIEREINAALWAWETFGGIGARTRRGFGSLTLVECLVKSDKKEPDVPQNIAGVRKWIEAKLKEFEVKGKWDGDVPHLPTAPSATWLKITQAREKGKPEPSAIEVWTYLIRKLKEFRQARFNKKGFREGRGKIKDDYGISRWPEANEIRRRIMNTKKIVDSSTPSKFPRAKLGLPINFHLPHDEDEPNIILRGEATQRRASPLILRPLTCLDKKTVGLALLLEPTKLPPGDLTLDGVPAGNSSVTAALIDLTIAEATQIEPLYRQANVLQAFLSTIS